MLVPNASDILEVVSHSCSLHAVSLLPHRLVALIGRACFGFQQTTSSRTFHSAGWGNVKLQRCVDRPTLVGGSPQTKKTFFGELHTYLRTAGSRSNLTCFRHCTHLCRASLDRIYFGDAYDFTAQLPTGRPQPRRRSCASNGRLPPPITAACQIARRPTKRIAPPTEAMSFRRQRCLARLSRLRSLAAPHGQRARVLRFSATSYPPAHW